MFCPVKNVCLCSAGVIVLNQNLLHNILNELHCWDLFPAQLLHYLISQLSQAFLVKGVVNRL